MPYAVVQGRKIYYEAHGDHVGPPLLLATGTGGSCRGWIPLQVPDFSRERRTVIFDYPGVGESEPFDGAFSTADLAELTAGLIETLELGRVDVLGAFMGGMVAQELALRHPERVDRLVLVGTYARPDAKRRLLLQQWKELAGVEVGTAIWVRDRLLWTVQDETLEQTDIIDAMVDYFNRESPPLSAELFVQQCDACLRHDTFDRLRDIDSRTLVICGRHDQLTPPSLHRQLDDELPNSRLVTLSYGAHLVMVESAQAFNAVVLDFLREDR